MIYFCCGAMRKDAPGCRQARHCQTIQIEDPGLDLPAAEGACGSCGGCGHGAEECPFDPNLRTGALITRRAAESEMARLEVMSSKSTKDSHVFDEPKRILIGKGFELDAMDG